MQPGVLQFFGMALLLLTQNADYNESTHCMYISLSKSVLEVAVAKDQIASTPVRKFINKYCNTMITYLVITPGQQPFY